MCPALGEDSDDEGESPALGSGGATSSAGEDGKVSLDARIRRGNLQYQTERAAATAAPTRSFAEKKTPIFDDLSPAFDKVKFAAVQQKIKAEKVCFPALAAPLPQATVY